MQRSNIEASYRLIARSTQQCTNAQGATHVWWMTGRARMIMVDCQPLAPTGCPLATEAFTVLGFVYGPIDFTVDTKSLLNSFTVCGKRCRTFTGSVVFFTARPRLQSGAAGLYAFGAAVDAACLSSHDDLIPRARMVRSQFLQLGCATKRFTMGFLPRGLTRLGSTCEPHSACRPSRLKCVLALVLAILLTANSLSHNMVRWLAGGIMSLLSLLSFLQVRGFSLCPFCRSASHPT